MKRKLLVLFALPTRAEGLVQLLAEGACDQLEFKGIALIWSNTNPSNFDLVPEKRQHEVYISGIGLFFHSH